MKISFIVISFSLAVLFSCKGDDSNITFDKVTFSLPLKNFDIKNLTEGKELIGNVEDISIRIESSYYSNNCYEYDVRIIPTMDTAQKRNLEENQIPFIVSDIPSQIDLDYYRIYNVSFDTVDEMPMKIITPRIPFSNSYKIFIPKIPGTYRKNIGYKSLTAIFENIHSQEDAKVFENFYQSIKRSNIK